MAKLCSGVMFDSYSEFQATLKAHEKENHVLYVVEGSNKLDVGHPDAERLRYKVVRYVCKQGAKTHSRSCTGTRPRQRSYKCNCESSFRVNRCRGKDHERYVLKITACRMEHNNHPMDAVTASLYPENRHFKLTDTIREMIVSDVTMGEIQSHIFAEQGINVMKSDVYNLKRKLFGLTKRKKKITAEDGLKRIKNESFIKDNTSLSEVSVMKNEVSFDHSYDNGMDEEDNTIPDEDNLTFLDDHVTPIEVMVMGSKDNKSHKNHCEGVEEVLTTVWKDGGLTEFGVTEEGEFDHIYMVTKEMRHNLSTVLDVLVLDLIHQENFPTLINIMCLGSDGCGYPAFQGFVSSENYESILSCLIFVKSVCVQEPFVFFVDKEFCELGAIRSIFPNASILQYAFHTPNIIKTALEHHGVSPKIIGVILGHFKEQRDTTSEEKYFELQRRIRLEAPESVVLYFETSWWNVPYTWAMHSILDLQSLHISTCKQVEDFHKRLQDVMEIGNTLSHCLSAILNLLKNIALARKVDQQFKCPSHHSFEKNCSPLEAKMKKTLSPFAAKIGIEQLMLAKARKYNVQVFSNQSTYRISAERSERAVSFSVSFSSCDCFFHQEFDLPCRHIFALNTYFKRPLFDISICKQSRFAKSITCQKSGQSIDSHESRIERVSVLTSGINNLLSKFEGKKFLHQMCQLQKIFDLVSQDKPFSIVEQSQTDNYEDSTITSQTQIPSPKKTADGSNIG